MFDSIFRKPRIKISPPNKAEKLQYRAIRKAIETGRCTITINPDTFNNKYSPVYNVMENFMPLLVLIILSLIVLIGTNIIFGMVFLLVSVLSYVVFLKPWAEKMVIHRVYTLMMRNYYNFQYLWMMGGITLTLTSNPIIGCKAPEGDWKSLSAIHFSDLMTISFLPKAPPLPTLPPPPHPVEPEEFEEGEEQEEEEDLFNFDDLDLR